MCVFWKVILIFLNSVILTTPGNIQNPTFFTIYCLNLTIYKYNICNIFKPCYVLQINLSMVRVRFISMGFMQSQESLYQGRYQVF